MKTYRETVEIGTIVEIYRKDRDHRGLPSLDPRSWCGRQLRAANNYSRPLTFHSKAGKLVPSRGHLRQDTERSAERKPYLFKYHVRVFRVYCPACTHDSNRDDILHRLSFNYNCALVYFLLTKLMLHFLIFLTLNTSNLLKFHLFIITIKLRQFIEIDARRVNGHIKSLEQNPFQIIYNYLKNKMCAYQV